MLIQIFEALVLFYGLGLSADLVVRGVKQLSLALGINIFVIGLIIGALTSLPEFFLAWQSVFTGLTNIAVGNLLGGVVVIFGFVLSLNIIIQKEIKTPDPVWQIFSVCLYALIPLVIGYFLPLSRVWGLIIMIIYFILLTLFIRHHQAKSKSIEILPERKIIRDLLYIFLGLLGLAIFSYWLIFLSQRIIIDLGLDQFFVGVIFFALGTNLPELTLTLVSWKKQVRELSFSTLLGSVMTNICLVGLIAFARGFAFVIDLKFILLFFSLLILGLFTSLFYRTGKIFSRSEGIVLLLIYIGFLASQLFINI